MATPEGLFDRCYGTQAKPVLARADTTQFELTDDNDDDDNDDDDFADYT